MARSPLTLAAAASAAVPGVEIVEVTGLTTGEGGRNDAAVATLHDGKRIVVRMPQDEAVDADLATEALALRALTDGVRALLDFHVPEFLGAAPLQGGRVFVTTFVPGYLVDAPYIPAGRGVAASLGRSIAAVHALPTTVVRSAGLPARTSTEVRADVRRVMDESSATGKVPVRLMVRWRDVIDDDAMWQFEPCVTLGGAGAEAYVYQDKNGEPAVNGVIDWHGLQVSDPAIDLQFLQSAPEAADSVYGAYAEASHRAPDEMLRIRARLHSELEFARWLLHGRDVHRDDIMDDAAALLDALAEDIRDVDLRPHAGSSDVAGAMAALQNVPAAATTGIDTSMQTDAYDPDDLTFYDDGIEQRRVAEGLDTVAVDEADLPPTIDSPDASAPVSGDTQRIDPLLLGEMDPNATQPLSAADLAALQAGDDVADSTPRGRDRIDPEFLAGLAALHDTGDLSAITGIDSGIAPRSDDNFDPDSTQPIDPGFFSYSAGDDREGDAPESGNGRTGMHGD